MNTANADISHLMGITYLKKNIQAGNKCISAN